MQLTGFCNLVIKCTLLGQLRVRSAADELCVVEHRRLAIFLPFYFIITWPEVVSYLVNVAPSA